MANFDDRATNQIAVIMTAKKCVAAYDKLKAADAKHYAQIHAKGEESGGMKRSSLIGFKIQDYSKGTGANTVTSEFNLSPEQAQFIFSRVEAGWQDFEFFQDKIYGTPDAQGYATAQKFSITRHAVDQNGQVMRSPWKITISNGRGIKKQNSTGGFYMQGGSYKQEKLGVIALSDADCFAFFKRIDSFIRAWEDATAAEIVKTGKAEYEKAVEQWKSSQPNYGRQGGANRNANAGGYGNRGNGGYGQQANGYGQNANAGGYGNGGYGQQANGGYGAGASGYQLPQNGQVPAGGFAPAGYGR